MFLSTALVILFVNAFAVTMSYDGRFMVYGDSFVFYVKVFTRQLNGYEKKPRRTFFNFGVTMLVVGFYINSLAGFVNLIATICLYCILFAL